MTAGRPGPVRPPACPGDARLRQPGACQRLKSMHAGSTPHARALAPDMAYEALRGNIACGRRTRHHVAWRRDRSAPGPARGPGILTSSIARRAPSGPAVASPIRMTLRQKPGKRGYTTAPDPARLGGRALKRPNSERHPPTSPDFRQKCGGRRSRTLGASRCLPLTASAARRRARGPSSSASCVTLPPCAGHCREGVIGAAARRRSVCPGPAYGTRKSTAQTSSPMVGPGLRPGRGRASKLFFAAAAKANSVVPHCQTGASASAIAPLWAE